MLDIAYMHGSNKLDSTDECYRRSRIKVVSDGVYEVSCVYLDIHKHIQHVDI